MSDRIVSFSLNLIGHMCKMLIIAWIALPLILLPLAALDIALYSLGWPRWRWWEVLGW